MGGAINDSLVTGLFRQVAVFSFYILQTRPYRTLHISRLLHEVALMSLHLGIWNCDHVGIITHGKELISSLQKVE
jgi:hypothetical protein